MKFHSSVNKGFSFRTLLKSVIFHSPIEFLLSTGKRLRKSNHLRLASNLTTFLMLSSSSLPKRTEL